jgi:hypothetical protein
MKTYSKSKPRHNRPRLMRALACALLIGIVYSATFGALHSHRSVSSKFGLDSSAGSSVQAAAISVVPLRRPANGDECLICVLHRQFFSSVVHEPLFIVGPKTPVALARASTISYRSIPIVSGPVARLSGRAPPARQI